MRTAVLAGKCGASRAPLRVALVSSDYAADAYAGGGGGIESYVRLLAGGLARAGHEVHVVASAAAFTRSFDDGDVRIHAIRVPDEWNGRCAALHDAKTALSFAWHAYRKVRALASTVGPFDAIEAPEYKAQGYFIARDTRLPLVIKCHAHLRLCLSLNGIDLTPDTALIADLECETLHQARAIHVNSAALARRCGDDYGLAAERFEHIPYGIDVTRFSPSVSTAVRAELGVGDAPLALFVGRLEERKGITTLVDAFAEVVRELPGTVLLVVGPDVVGPPAHGSNLAWMREAWAGLGVPNDRIRFLGALRNDELPPLYAAADVMAAPSPFEAFGLVYLEAMSCGCPPIACAGGGAAEVILDGETGMLVPPGDAPALAKAMLAVLTDRARCRQYAVRGRQHVEEHYTLDAMVDRTARFYRETLS